MLTASFFRPAASQKPRNSAAIPSVSFLAGCKDLLVTANKPHEISGSQKSPVAGQKKDIQAFWRRVSRHIFYAPSFLLYG